jgi:hypothetical protein
MSPLRAGGGAGCPGDASAEKTTSVAAATPDATPAVVTPALRKSRRVVFMFEPPKYLLHVLVWPSAGKSGYSRVSLIRDVEKAVCMLRQAQHERKIINVFQLRLRSP